MEVEGMKMLAFKNMQLVHKERPNETEKKIKMQFQNVREIVAMIY